MKAFILGVVATAALSVGAWFVLTAVVGDTAAQNTAADAVRLGEAGPSDGNPLEE